MFLNRHIFLCLFLAVVMTTILPAMALEPSRDMRCFEMRTYYAAPGQLDHLHTRFREHTMRLFQKHGMTNIGYWTPIENPDNRLIYVLAYPSREAREISWKAFDNDPEWKHVRSESEKNGRIVAKVESRILVATDFSPQIRPSVEEPRVFELRTYTTTEGNLDRLLKRFREHTTRLFESYGMTNLAYWTLAPGQPGAENTLIYILAHKSRQAGEASFRAFRADPDWIAAKGASEKESGGSLTAANNGVISLYMQATDYSPTR